MSKLYTAEMWALLFMDQLTKLQQIDDAFQVFFDDIFILHLFQNQTLQPPSLRMHML